jgi:uncharacterized protein DUF998
VTQRDPAQNQLIVSYITLRRAVGWIGTLLPVVLITGNQLLFSGQLANTRIGTRPSRTLTLSLSDYYYTHMRNLLVGALIVLGVFMLCYAGYDGWDRWITNGAGLFLIGIAFFPTAPGVAGDIHVVVSALAFILLSVMAFRFTKTSPGSQPTGRKLARNRVYLICAVVMLSAQAVLGLLHVAFSSFANTTPVDFVFESLAVMAFGVSWLVKGQALLTDQITP